MKVIDPDVVVYGGAFDPPHLGHAACIHQVLELCVSSEVMVVPGYQPAGAKGIHKDPDACFEDRIALCESAFAAMDRVIVSPIESKMATPNYTFHTLNALKEQKPQVRLGLMIGLDQFKVFNRWKFPKEIMEIADLFVVRRDSHQSIVEVADYMMSNLGLTIEEWNQDKTVACIKNFGTYIRILSGETPHAASSEIKFRISLDKSLPPGWVNDAVLKLIKDRDLYSTVKESP